MEPWVSVVPEAARQLIARFWPGPLTLILKKSSRIPDIVTGGQDSVGLRCPAHPLAQSLLTAFASVGSGLVAAPSANRFGHVSPTTAQHVRDEFGPLVGDSIYLLDGGACSVGIESTILDLSRLHQDGVPVLLRPGAVSREQIQQTIGIRPLTREEYEQAKRETPRASGTLAAHYAPMTPLKLLSSTDLQKTVDAMLAAGQRVAVLAFSTKPKTPPSPVGVGVRNARPLLWISADTQADGYAHDLYAHLRTLDAGATAAILVEMPPQTGAWEAVNDRLTRAAAGSGTRHRTSD
ncbi:MAG: L-threonylcarbamoyladenylate synthase [Betaproteobacteria bacterium]|nr:L-threonylcarbamoyladenylate synthase [Betaproteobacteria bacterium]